MQSNYDVLEALGKEIKSRRKSKKLNRIEFSKITGVSIGTIDRIENGENYTSAALGAVCDALGIYLFFK